MADGEDEFTAVDFNPSVTPQHSPKPSPRKLNKTDHMKGDSESNPATEHLDNSNTDQAENSDKIGQEYGNLHLKPVSVPRGTQSLNSGTPAGKKTSTGTGSGSSSRSTSRSSSSTSNSSFRTTEDNISRGSDSSPMGESFRSTSQEIVKDKRDYRVPERAKKKSAWYNILNATYKTRSEEFKRMFKDVPPEERLIVDYSCAVQKEILIHGRLYVSQNYLCFHANIFMWETVITLRWKDVTGMTKEKTALVIPNAILICTEHEKLFFTTFFRRDDAYLMLFRVWQNALLGKQMSVQEILRCVRSSYGEELGLTSDEEDYFVSQCIDPASLNHSRAESEDGSIAQDDFIRLRVDDIHYQNCGNLSLESIRSDTSNTVPSIQTTDATPPPSTPNSSPLCSALDDSVIHGSESNLDEQLETDMSDTTESEPDKITDILGFLSGSGSCTSQHVGREMVKVVLPVNVDQLFTLLFTNSKFFTNFHESRNSTDIKQTSWSENEESQKLRTVCLTVNINQSVVGRRQSQVTEVQAMLKCSKPGKMYAIDCESSNAGVPYADSFFVAVHYCLNRVSDHESSLCVHADIKYKKSVFFAIRGFIEKHTWVGLEDFFNSLVKALKDVCGGDEENSIPGTHMAPKLRRRLRASQRQSNARLVDDDVPPRLRSSVARRSLPRGSIPPSERISDTVTSSAIANSASESGEGVNLVILGVLVILLILNGVLYYKLWCLEQWSMIDSIPPHLNIDLKALSNNPPTTQEEWMNLLRQQESLHTLEMQKWQKILQSSTLLLRQTEEALKELQLSIQPKTKHKLLSIIQELSSNVEEKLNKNSEF